MSSTPMPGDEQSCSDECHGGVLASRCASSRIAEEPEGRLPVCRSKLW